MHDESVYAMHLDTPDELNPTDGFSSIFENKDAQSDQKLFCKVW